jgi:hypothetical protein
MFSIVFVKLVQVTRYCGELYIASHNKECIIHVMCRMGFSIYDKLGYEQNLRKRTA